MTSRYLRTTATRAREVLSGFTTGQKTVTALAVLGLVLGGLAFSRWAATPSMVPLFSNLSATDASAITDKLTAAKEPYTLADGGATILVPDKDVYQLRLSMSAANLPSGGDTAGYSLLDKQGITTSDFQQQVQYQRALEGELTKTISAIDGVQAAVVHLAVPKESVFATEQQPPTASVLVRTAPGRSLTSDQVQAVVHLVSASVTGLDPSQVTVADATGKVLNAAGMPGGGTGDVLLEQRMAVQDSLSASLQQMVDSVVGPGHSVVRVNADLDFDNASRTTETYLQPSPGALPVAETTSEEKYAGTGGGATAGVLGPDNIAVPGNVAGAGGNSTYTRNDATKQNAVGKVTEQVQQAPGKVKRLSVAVLLDERTAGAADTAKVTDLVNSAAGIDAKRGDTVTVNALPFDQTAAERAAAELAAQASAGRTATLLGYLRTAGLLLVALVVAVVLLRRGRNSGPKVQALTAEQIRELEERRALPAPREATLDLVDTPALPAVDEVTNHRLTVADEIGQMVERQPEEVAQLLRGWLADRRS